MKITLSPEIEQFIHTQVAIGRYTSASEVIMAGMKLFVDLEHIYKGRFEELRQEVIKGVEAANEGNLVEIDVVFQTLYQKLAKPSLKQLLLADPGRTEDLIHSPQGHARRRTIPNLE